jgi:hypothetical protein
MPSSSFFCSGDFWAVSVSPWLVPRLKISMREMRGTVSSFQNCFLVSVLSSAGTPPELMGTVISGPR